MTKEHEQAIEILEEVKILDDSIYQYNSAYLEALEIAIQAIKDLDKMNGIALDLASENDELIEKMDAIRAEIKEKYGDYDICEWLEDYDYEDNNISEYRQVGKMSDILQIIDKYRGESKDADSN